jgi:3-hydroxybutyryl-CoA dehydrogenase
MDEIRAVGIVGAGFMGTGIAESAAAAGLEVAVYEPIAGGIERSRKSIDTSLARSVERGKRTEADARDLLGRITWSDERESLAGSQLVIEAVVEDGEIKAEVFAELDGLLSDAAVLASNTSSIPITGLAAATTRPQRVLGLHFFSPVPVMKLVEVVVGLETSPEALATAETFAAKIGKTAIRTKDRSGFVVNMLLVPYLMAAVRMYEDGFATREDIDQGMQLGCGHPMGPLALCDLIGLDVLYSVCDSLYDEFKRDEYAPPPLMRRMVAAGHLGRKAGRGFYEYD